MPNGNEGRSLEIPAHNEVRSGWVDAVIGDESAASVLSPNRGHAASEGGVADVRKCTNAAHYT